METNDRKKRGMIGTALGGLALIISSSGCGTIRGVTRDPEAFNQPVQKREYRTNNEYSREIRLESRPYLYEKDKEKGMLEDFGNEAGRVLKQIKDYN